MPADLGGVAGLGEPDPVMSRQDAARVLCELFLTNAERGNHAVNDELVAGLVHRIRAQQQSRDHHNSQPPPGYPTDPTR